MGRNLLISPKNVIKIDNTGFASYLLRIKPPEKNGTLTNLEKMHIIALSEERKKNAKNNERADGIIENLQKTSDASLRQTTKTSKPNKVTKSKDYHINEETKPEDKKESSISGAVPLLKSGSLSQEMPLATQYDMEKADPVLQTEKIVEYPTPEKKMNNKNSSVSQITFSPESTPLLAEDIKPQSEDEITNTEIITSNEEILQNTITEPQDSGVSDQINNKTPECEPVEQDNLTTSESVKAESETENPTFPVEVPVDSASSERRPSQLDESNTIAETVSSKEVVVETCPAETMPLDSKDEEQAPKEDNIDTEVSLDSNRLEESEKHELPSSENEQINDAALDSEEINIESQLNQLENVDTIAESNFEKADLTETNQTPMEEEKEPTAEIIENISTMDIPEAQEESTQMDTTSIHNVQESNSDINEPSKPLDEIISEDSKEKEVEQREEENDNELKLSGSSDIHNIIEEVTGMGNSESTKENEAEPLIEEPQSPEITEVESEKMSSNIITEVLSDVAEES